MEHASTAPDKPKWTAEGIIRAISAAVMPKDKRERKTIAVCFTQEVPWLAEGPVLDAFLKYHKGEKGFLVPAEHKEKLVPILRTALPGTRIFSFDGEDEVLGETDSQGQLFGAQ